jgi:hypothetical protein
MIWKVSGARHRTSLRRVDAAPNLFMPYRQKELTMSAPLGFNSNVVRKTLMVLVSTVLTASSADAFAQRALSAGPGATGGGNSINGKSVESYIRDVEDLPGFNESVKPFLQLLASQNQGFARLFEKTMHELIWVASPVMPAELPPSITGIPVKTDQTIAQNFTTGVVWIGMPSFNKLTPKGKEQGKLIVHEVFQKMLVFECAPSPGCDYRITKATGITYRLVHKLFEKNLTKPYSRLEVAGILYDRKLELQSDTHRAIQQEFECTQYAQQPSTRWAHGEDVYDCEVVRDRVNGDVFSLGESDELQRVFRKSVRPGH